MATSRSFARLRPLLTSSRTARSHGQKVCLACRQRWSSTAADTAKAPSPTLSRLREDLKSAMRAKDTARLGVLRAVLAEITNASKTNKPITDDLSLLALLKKKISQSQAAVEEFYQADRQDLVMKEQEQLHVLRSYADSVKVLDRSGVQRIVKEAIEEVRADGRKLALGDVMKRMTGPGGKLEGKPVEMSVVVGVIRDELGENKS